MGPKAITQKKNMVEANLCALSRHLNVSTLVSFGEKKGSVSRPAIRVTRPKSVCFVKKLQQIVMN